MTIRIINVPTASESFYYVLTNVKEVTKFNIIFHDGSKTLKKICSKVEIISILDAPNDYDESEQFFIDIGCSKYDKIRECVVADRSGYKKMKLQQFYDLELPTYL